MKKIPLRRKILHLGDKIEAYKKIHSSSAHTVEFASVAADNDKKKQRQHAVKWKRIQKHTKRTERNSDAQFFTLPLLN